MIKWLAGFAALLLLWPQGAQAAAHAAESQAAFTAAIAWMRATQPGEPVDRLARIALAARTACREAGDPFDWRWLVALAEVESGFDPASGRSRGESGARGVWQIQQEHAQAYRDQDNAPITGARLETDIEHAARVAVRILRRRLETGAPPPPPSTTYRQRAQQYADEWRSKDTPLELALDVQIQPARNGWLAHWNRGAYGVGRWPQLQSPVRADGSAFQVKVESNFRQMAGYLPEMR